MGIPWFGSIPIATIFIIIIIQGEKNLLSNKNKGEWTSYQNKLKKNYGVVNLLQQIVIGE